MGITFWIYMLMISVAVVHAMLSVISIPLCGALTVDALGHAVLLGVTVGFFFVKKLTSPWLFVGAILAAFFMYFLEYILVRYTRVQKDSATGISFSLCFSLAVILLTIYAREIHLDLDMILVGNIEYALYDKWELCSFTFPTMFWFNLIIIFFLALFFLLFYRTFQVILFDKTYAQIIGYSMKLVTFLAMALTSVVVVTSLNVCGAIVLVGLSAAPFAGVWHRTSRLATAMAGMILFAIFNAIIAATLGIYFDVSLSGILVVTSVLHALILNLGNRFFKE